PRPGIGPVRLREEWLAGLADEECRWWFRFTYPELRRLKTVLRIPDPFITRQRAKFSAIEALCLLLYRYRSGADLYLLQTLFGRSAFSLSILINDLTVMIDAQWGFLLDFDTEGVLSIENIFTYADAIHAAGCPLDCIWALLDCTIKATCRPKLWQRLMYTGHKKCHGQKFQALV
ncbi:hypothetical protein C8Q80DRAFT_1065340, partial [Daedaleopsis nitida]